MGFCLYIFPLDIFSSPSEPMQGHCLINGALIASMLREVSAAAAAEGFIYGDFTAISRSHATDAREATKTVMEECVLCGYTVTGRRLSFYDMQGALSRSAIGAARAQRENRTVVGWFVVKSNGILTPSIREAAVHKQLSLASDLRGDSRPLVFLSLATAINSAECTQSMDIQCFVQAEGGLAMRPTPLYLSNLTHDSAAEHSSFWSAPDRGYSWYVRVP